MKFHFLVAVCILFSVSACAKNPSYIAGQEKLPRKVSDLVYRIVDCNHWSGEYGHDEERTAEIEAALDELRCYQIEKDKEAMLERFRADPAVENAIREAEDIVW